MMSKRKGSVADKAGSWIAKLAGLLRAPNNFPDGIVVMPGLVGNWRLAQIAARTKKIEKAPRRRSEPGKPPSSIGIRNIHPPITTNVRNKTTKIDSKAPVATARKMAIRSTQNTRGQTTNETSAKLKIGIRISTRASAGNKWFHHGKSILRNRCSTSGATECNNAKTKNAASAT